MIDWQRVTELRDEIGAEDFEEVAEIFLEEVDEIIYRLTNSPDPARFEEDLHLLKGSALNLGFRDFATLCADGEQMSAGGRAGEVTLAPIIACYHASKTQFAAQLQTDRAA